MSDLAPKINVHLPNTKGYKPYEQEARDLTNSAISMWGEEELLGLDPLLVARIGEVMVASSHESYLAGMARGLNEAGGGTDTHKIYLQGIEEGRRIEREKP